MNKLGASVTAAVLAAAISITGTSAEAATKAKRKKIGFFESLFGESTARKATPRKRRSAFGNKWFTDEEQQDQDRVTIIRGSKKKATRSTVKASQGKKRKRIVPVEADPEADPGIGMGNLPYAPERLVALGGSALGVARPTGAVESAIFDALASPDLGVRVLPDSKEPILAQYRVQNFRPVWLANGALSERGRAVLNVLAAADLEGLDSSGLLPPTLAGFDQPLPQDAASLAKLDIGITAMALKYAGQASGGQFDPRRLSLYHDIKPAASNPDQAIKVIAWSPYPAEYLQSLHPKHPAYAAFKAELAKYLTSSPLPPPEPIADGPIIKIGRSDDRLVLIRARLAERGFDPPEDHFAEDPLVLDAELSARLKAFQKAAGIKVSGLVGPQTIGALNGETRIDRRMALANNMERLRWLPKDLGARHVFVNQAAFETWVWNNGKEEWRSRVIVGRPMTQTAVFSDEMETVVVNPSWGVPQSIIRNEYLPKLRNDPSYLDRIGFKVVNSSGRVVSSSDVDWWGYANGQVGVQQPPGDDNALGKLKFLFPNGHDIYMHDTPNRQLFERSVRSFSHGCVRVQNPQEFASVLLGLDEMEIDDMIASGKSQTIKLKQKLPVHLAYFTAWPNAAGEIVYYNDIYGRDKTLNEARSAITVAQR